MTKLLGLATKKSLLARDFEDGNVDNNVLDSIAVK